MFAILETLSSEWDAVSRYMVRRIDCTVRAPIEALPVQPSLRKLRAKTLASRAACDGRPKSPAPVDLDDTELAFIYGRKRLVHAEAVPNPSDPSGDLGATAH